MIVQYFVLFLFIIIISTVDCRRRPRSGNLKWIDGAPPPRQVYVKRGDAIDLRCSASGEPCAKYTFFKNGIALIKLETDRYRISSDTLTIFAADNTDQSIYQCMPKNKHGYLWANFKLILIDDNVHESSGTDSNSDNSIRTSVVPHQESSGLTDDQLIVVAG